MAHGGLLVESKERCSMNGNRISFGSSAWKSELSFMMLLSGIVNTLRPDHILIPVKFSLYDRL